MHGILCVNPTDPFQCHGLRRQHQEYRLDVLMIVSSYTWPKGCDMSQMGMPRSNKRTTELVMCSFRMSLYFSTSPYFRSLQPSKHFEEQMFCAPCGCPRHEPEGLAHGVAEQCLRNRLMFLALVFHVSRCQYSWHS